MNMSLTHSDCSPLENSSGAYSNRSLDGVTLAHSHWYANSSSVSASTSTVLVTFWLLSTNSFQNGLAKEVGCTFLDQTLQMRIKPRIHGRRINNGCGPIIPTISFIHMAEQAKIGTRIHTRGCLHLTHGGRPYGKRKCLRNTCPALHHRKSDCHIGVVPRFYCTNAPAIPAIAMRS